MRAPACLLVGLLASACADTGPAPYLELEGRALRLLIQRGGSAEESGEESPGAPVRSSRDLARVPFTSEENTELEREVWPEEAFAIELTADQLFQLRPLIGGDAGREVAGRIFTDAARLAAPGTTLAGPEPVGPGVTRRAWSVPTGNAELELAAWWKSLATWRESVARVRWARFLPSDVEFHAAGARVELDWEVNVELESGGLRHDRGTWTSEWVPPPDVAEAWGETSRATSSLGWRCRELAPLRGATLSAERASFVDVTGGALRGTKMSPLFPHPEERKEHYRGIALVDVDGDDDLDIVTSIPNTLLLGDGECRFEDVTERAGIRRERGFTAMQAADFDRDGDIDIVFTGKRRHALFYEQVGPARFEGHPILASRDDNHPSSMTAHDVDEDGWLDLMICGYGPLVDPGPSPPSNAANARNDQMLRGGPDGFTDVTEAWGLWRESSRWAFIGSFGDADGDGDDDLYVANDFGPNVLYRRVRRTPPLFEPELEPPDEIASSFSMSATWADLDGDLDLDMYVSNMESVDVRRMERLPGHAASEPWERELRDLMSRGNTVLIQEDGDAGTTLVEAPDSAGARNAKWAWGTALFDWDEDGDVDIHCVNGFKSIGIDDGRDWDSLWWRHALGDRVRDRRLWIESLTVHFPRSADHGWSWAGHQRSVFYLNDGNARFTEIAPVLGLDQISDGRGLAMGDLDRDGDHDLVGSNIDAPHLYVLRNDTVPDAGFAWIELVPADNRSAAGAEIRLSAGGREQRRDVALAAGFLSQHELASHFGLGAADGIERVEIDWPDGERTVLEDLPANRRLRVTQGVPGWEEVPLRPRNYNGTFRLGEVEWANDLTRIERIGNSLNRLLGEAVEPSPLERPAPAGTIRAVVLRDPEGDGSPTSREDLAELDGIEGLEVVIVTPPGVSPPALPAGLAASRAVYSSEESRRALVRGLARWCGTHNLPWPVVIYCDRANVGAISRGAIAPERIRVLCNLAIGAAASVRAR